MKIKLGFDMFKESSISSFKHKLGMHSRSHEKCQCLFSIMASNSYKGKLVPRLYTQVCAIGCYQSHDAINFLSENSSKP